MHHWIRKTFTEENPMNLVFSMILWGITIFSLLYLLNGNYKEKSCLQESVETLGRGMETDKNSLETDRKRSSFCVVIDAGHGGIDPGKVGINGSLEKDINLDIAFRLQKYLKMQNVEVVMTRAEDRLLTEESDKGFKTRDMKKRVELLEDTKPDIAVSIHQNSYQAEKVRGAQVFYYSRSEEGEKLAGTLQEVLAERLDSVHKRTIKENNTYYLLKNTSIPMVIVECGFLSNKEEAELLSTEDYRDRVAWNLHLGILRYLNERNARKDSAG